MEVFVCALLRITVMSCASQIVTRMRYTISGPERTKTATCTSVEAVPHPGCQWVLLAEIEDGWVLFFDGAGGLWFALALADDARAVGLGILAFWLALTVT